MIAWSERIDIDRPLEEVHHAVLDQQVLMTWSAWPQATGYTLGPRRSRVRLNFRISPPVPAPLCRVARLFLNLRIRPLHGADLTNLKRLLESEVS